MKVKHNNKSRKIIWAGIILAWIILIAFSGVYVWQRFFKTPGITTTTIDGVTTTVDETPITEKDIENHKAADDSPRYISIPDLGIEKAIVVQIGLVPNTNRLDSPISIYNAGWYTSSVKPGSGGGAVLMDGHNGGPNYGGIFEKLGSLRVGSKIIVERGDGEKITYEVRDNRQMKLEEINDPANPYGMATMLNSIDSNKEGLNLITCVGEWLRDSQTFNSRVMLRAVRVG